MMLGRLSITDAIYTGKMGTTSRPCVDEEEMILIEGRYSFGSFKVPLKLVQMR